jgi:hypothetical protein
MDACYSFDKSMMPPLADDLCATAQETATVTTCPATAVWFWGIAAVIAGYALFKRDK